MVKKKKKNEKNEKENNEKKKKKKNEKMMIEKNCRTLASHAKFSTISRVLYRNVSLSEENQQPVLVCNRFSEEK